MIGTHSGERPRMLKPELGRFPEELTELKRWVLMLVVSQMTAAFAYFPRVHQACRNAQLVWEQKT